MAPLILVGLVAVIIIVAAAVGAFMFLNSGSSSAPAGGTDGGSAASCSMEQFNLECVKDTCFNGGDELVDDSDFVAVDEVSCNQEHRWEAYAKGKLPSDVPDPKYGTVAALEKVEKTCILKAESSPLATRVGGLAAAADWSPDVLPPTKEQFDDGDRGFMCVAERKGGESTTERL